MEEKNDLLQGMNNDNNMKKYLIIGGLVFVIFVVGIVVAKLMFSSSNQNTKVILPPETTTKVQKSDTELFNSIPVEDNKQNKQVSNNQDNFEKPVVQDTNNFVNNKQELQNKPEVVQQPKKVEEIQQKPVYKPVIQPKKVTNIVDNSNKNYYIQVAAVTRGNPSKKFLEVITKNGFNYKIVTVNIKDKTIKRVLVGRFTKNEAKKALPKIKTNISSSAFIKRLKWNIKIL